MKIAAYLTAVAGVVFLIACGERSAAKGPASTRQAVAAARAGEDTVPVAKISHTDDEWRAMLTPQQYDVLRQKGTEQAFTGAYWDNHEKGIYACAACGLELFNADTKFDSGTGWPSFWQPIVKSHVDVQQDNSHGMERNEVRCARCGGHLGHVFDDGPKPTGLRYCINSVSLRFIKKS